MRWPTPARLVERLVERGLLMQTASLSPPFAVTDEDLLNRYPLPRPDRRNESDEIEVEDDRDRIAI